MYLWLNCWRNNVPQQCATTMLHNNMPQQSATTMCHNNAPQQCATTMLNNNAPQQCATMLHNNAPKQYATTMLHNNVPQQCSTTMLRNNVPQCSTTMCHNNAPQVTEQCCVWHFYLPYNCICLPPLIRTSQDLSANSAGHLSITVSVQLGRFNEWTEMRKEAESRATSLL